MLLEGPGRRVCKPYVQRVCGTSKRLRQAAGASFRTAASWGSPQLESLLNQRMAAGYRLPPNIFLIIVMAGMVCAENKTGGESLSFHLPGWVGFVAEYIQ